MLIFLALVVTCCFPMLRVPGAAPSALPVLDGVTFAGDPDHTYVPVREAAVALGRTVEWNARNGAVLLDGRAVPSPRLRRLVDGTRLAELDTFGAAVSSAVNEDERTLVCDGDPRATVRIGAKRVEVDLTRQELRAWQGERLVLQTRVSTGAEGHLTPPGSYHAGPEKQRMHYSRLYDNAPMPWSVQIGGNVFIHGYSSVPRYPASHGCIRVPLTGGNPARWFYSWVDIGTPIEVVGEWRDRTDD